VRVALERRVGREIELRDERLPPRRAHAEVDVLADAARIMPRHQAPERVRPLLPRSERGPEVRAVEVVDAERVGVPHLHQGVRERRPVASWNQRRGPRSRSFALRPLSTPMPTWSIPLLTRNAPCASEARRAYSPSTSASPPATVRPWTSTRRFARRTSALAVRSSSFTSFVPSSLTFTSSIVRIGRGLLA